MRSRILTAFGEMEMPCPPIAAVWSPGSYTVTSWCSWRIRAAVSPANSEPTIMTRSLVLMIHILGDKGGENEKWVEVQCLCNRSFVTCSSTYQRTPKGPNYSFLSNNSKVVVRNDRL